MSPGAEFCRPEQVAAFFRKHRTGLVSIVFTDLVDSTALLSQLGDQAGATFMQRRRQLIRETLRTLPEGEEIETAGDSFLLAFAKPSDGVRFALQVQARLREFSRQSGLPVQERIGIHLGEVVIAENETEAKAKDLYGLQLATCARLTALAEGGQILLTRGAFDSARQVLKGEDVPGVGALSWVSHGPYQLKGIEEPVEVCEVGEAGQSALAPPKTSEKAHRQVRPNEEPVLGWRPAVGQNVPNTKWVLGEKLGEGGFGEVWVGRHQTLKADQRVFKFCFRADRVRSLKREVTLFRLLKERTGEHPNIVRLYEVYFDQPPFYLEEEYVPGKDLKNWCEVQGGIQNVPLEIRLEIVAQAAEALQAAHDAGVIHRDVKPGNILVSGPLSVASSSPSASRNAPDVPHAPPAPTLRPPVVKLSDFGIGQVVSLDYLSGVTKAGFTMTLMGTESSSQSGTHLYMAPELLAGKPATIRSDIYSLGVVLYQLLVADFGRPVATDWADGVQDPLLRDDLKRCFAGNPDDRFAGAAQLASNLRAWEQRKEQAARLEQLQRSAERRRKLVLVSSVVALSTLLLALALGYGMRKAQSERALERRLSYATDLAVAQHALAENNLKFATELLDRQKPRRGEEDLRGWEWRYLWQQCQPSDFAHYGGGWSSSAAYSPDGRWLAYHLNSQVIIRDARSLQVFTNLPVVSSTLSFSPRAPLLAVACSDTNVTLWSTDTWHPVRTLPGTTFIAVFSPDGRWLAAMGTNEFLLWDTTTWEVKATCQGKVLVPFGVRHLLAFSPSSEYLLAPSWSTNYNLDGFRLWKLPDLEPVPGLEASEAGASAGAFSADGKYLFMGTIAGTLEVWDIAQRRRIQTENAHGWFISRVLTSRDGATLMTAGDHTLAVWDTASRKLLSRWRGHLGYVDSLDLSPDGRTVCSVGHDGMRLWSVEKNLKVERLIGSSRVIGFSPDSASLVSELEEGLRIWDLSTGATNDMHCPGLAYFYDFLYPAANIAVHPREWIAATGMPNGTVEIWDLRSRQRQQIWPAHQEAIRALTFSPDGNLLATASTAGHAALWNVAKQELVHQFTPLRFKVTCLQFSPDGHKLMISGESESISVFDLAKGQEQPYIESTNGWASDLAFTPDGALLAATAVQSTSINLLDGNSGKLRGVLAGPVQPTVRLAFSPDGRTLAGGIDTKDVILWDLRTGQQLIHMPCDGWFESLSFSPDGRIMAVGSSKGKKREIRLFRAPYLKEIEPRNRN